MRKSFAAVAAAGLMVVLAAPHGGAADVTHEVQPETTIKSVEKLPCVGGKAKIKITYTAVFRTVESDRVLHTSGKADGTFVANPLKEGRPKYKGHFSQQFRFMSKPGTRHELGSFAFTVIGRAVDGSDSINLHETGKFVRTENGRRVDFERSDCR